MLSTPPTGNKLVHVIRVRNRSMQVVDNPVIVEDGIAANIKHVPDLVSTTMM